MAPLDLEGDNLGQRHKHYNQLVQDAVNQKLPFEEIRYREEHSDLDRLFKIDLAAHHRNVNYILDVVKSNDMLQVSRAINNSEWLFTDKQYRDIINPQHLNDILIPQMTQKASCKLMLFIRLHLKDELRVKEFFEYYENINLQAALKWLPNCSLSYIETTIEKYHDVVDYDLFKRLCEKSFSILEIWSKKQSTRHYKQQIYIKSVMFLLNTHTDQYLDIIESVKLEGHMKFGPKRTQFLMEKCPDRIIKKFESYAASLDLKTFAKCMKKEDIKEFLLNLKKGGKLNHWFKINNIKYFVGLLPREEAFDFLKQVFIDKTHDKEDQSEAHDTVLYSYCSAPAACRTKSKKQNASKRNIYQWYTYAPFATAFNDLKNMIRAETSADERTAMLRIMLDAAGQDMKHIHTLLAFYQERHMNEQFKCKAQFINDLITRIKVHELQQGTWKILDQIFHSMEVYIESNNDVRKCVQNDLVYKLLHDEPIPEIIQRKFDQSNNLCFDEKRTQKENDIIFNYMYHRLEKHVDIKCVKSLDEFETLLIKVGELFGLLETWKKDLKDFPCLVHQVKDIIKMKIEKFPTDRGDVSFVYNNKAWRRYFFEESLVLQPSQDTIINILKHDTTLIKKWTNNIEAIMFSDSEPFDQFLRKLRIYWPHSLAKEWSQMYRNRLQTHGGNDVIVQSLSILLPLEELLSIIGHYAPTDYKINWSEADKQLLSVQKHLAKNMHYSRPHPPPASVMLYAKGDYLQFTMPSLNAVLHNLSVADSKKIIPLLLDAPVSIQKHGIRLATSKLDSHDAQEIVSKIWKSTKNMSLRSIIFKLTYNILCKKNTPLSISNNTWDILEMFIDGLNDSENKEIYTLLAKVEPLPDHLKGKYFVKSYKFLKSLPAKADCGGLLSDLALYSINLIDKIDHVFLHSMLVEYVQRACVDNKAGWNKFGEWYHLITAFVYYSPNEKIQQQRYEQILEPVLTFCLKKVDETDEDNDNMASYQCAKIFPVFLREFPSLLLENNVTVPTKILANMASLVERVRSVSDSYQTITKLKLAAEFSKLVEIQKLSMKKNDDSDVKCASGTCTKEDRWNHLLEALVPEFAKLCVEYLKRDMNTYFPSVFVIFNEALSDLTDQLQITSKRLFRFIEALLDPEFDYSYIIASTLLMGYVRKEDKKEAEKLRNLIKSHHSPEVRMFYYSKHKLNPF